MPLMAAALRFRTAVEHCASPNEVINALHDTIKSRINVMAIYRAPLPARRGSYRKNDRWHFPHRAVPSAYWNEFWREFEHRGPSFLARYAWCARRDFTMTEVIRKLKPAPQELWVVALSHRHGIGDFLYVPLFEWWFAVFWSPRPLRLNDRTVDAVRLAATAAAQQIERLIDDNDDEACRIRLAPREREIFHLLMANGTSEMATIDDVARQLHLSPSTVKVHVSRVRKKLGVRTLEAAALELVRRYVVLFVALSFAICGISEVCNFDLPMEEP